MQDSIEENSEFKQSEYFIEQNNYENIWIVNRIFENSCPQPDKSLNTKILPCDDPMKLTHIQHAQEMHLSFWINFYEMDFQPAKDEITFQQFGKSTRQKSLSFSLNKNKQLVIKYFTQELKLGKITSETIFTKNAYYFVCFSLYNTDKFTEIVLTVNCEMQTSVSFTYPLVNNFHYTIFGSEVFSSVFVGIVSDLMIVYAEWPAQAQVIYFENYFKFKPGTRAACMIQDFELHEKKRGKKKQKNFFIQ